MPSLDAQCLSVSVIVARTVLEDDHWRAFNYPRRPRRWKWFQGFVAAEKRERETVLQRELWAAAFGRVFCWALHRSHFRHRVEFLSRLFELCIDGIDQPLWPALQFPSRHDASSYLLDSCHTYGSSDQSEHVKIFLERCIGRLSQKPPAAWIVGTAWLFSHPNSWLVTMIPALDRTGVAENDESDLQIQNDDTRKTFRDLFLNLAP